MKCKLKSNVQRKEGSGEGRGGGERGEPGSACLGTDTPRPLGAGAHLSSEVLLLLDVSPHPGLGKQHQGSFAGGMQGPRCSRCRYVGAAPLSPRHPVAPTPCFPPKEGHCGDPPGPAPVTTSRGPGRTVRGQGGQGEWWGGPGGQAAELGGGMQARMGGGGWGVRCWCRSEGLRGR